MNQPQPPSMDQILREVMSDQTRRQRRIDLVKWLDGLPSSHENIVVCLLVLKSRNDEIGVAASNALKANAHQSILLRNPELSSVASKIIKSRLQNENRQVRIFGIWILFIGIMAFWASQTGYELVIADTIHLRNPIWGILLTITGIIIIIRTTVAIRSSENYPNYNQEISLKIDHSERQRVEKLGVEVAVCPSCGTVNSLALLSCEKCNTDLRKVKPIRNPFI